MQYEFYQKPTHSGKYMNYDSHCAQRTKLNIIVSETKRVWENCSKTSYTWPHLEKLRANLIKSNYPPDIVAKTMSKEITSLQRKVLTPSTPPVPKKQYDLIYKIPYVDEAFTRMVKKLLEEKKINARVVTVSGKTVETQGIYFLKLPNGILQPIDHTATHTATQTAARDVLCKNLNNHAADSTAPVCCSSLVLARACKFDFETLNFLACIF